MINSFFQDIKQQQYRIIIRKTQSCEISAAQRCQKASIQKASIQNHFSFRQKQIVLTETSFSFQTTLFIQINDNKIILRVY